MSRNSTGDDMGCMLFLFALILGIAVIYIIPFTTNPQKFHKDTIIGNSDFIKVNDSTYKYSILKTDNPTILYLKGDTFYEK